ncbi:MAG: Gfo/Idh/MocA family oxidoreductase [Chloroflexota bacterium]
MSKKLVVGVAGLGLIGEVRARNLAQLPTARLHAVASRRAETAQEVAQRYNAERFYTDYAQLFSDPALDAVIISTAIVDHVDHIVQAAEQGLHIFVEKPVAFALADIDRAAAAVEKAGVFCQVGFQRRYDPGYMAARQQLDQGVIGRPLLFKGLSRDPFWPEKQDGPGYNTTFLDLGVHDFDLARWLMGSEVRQIYATGAALVYPKLAEFGDLDNAVVSLVFENGTLGCIDFSRNARYGYDIRTEILGDEGALVIGDLQQTPLLTLTRRGVCHDVFPWYLDRFDAAFKAELAAFVTSIQHGRSPSPGLADARQATEIGLAALESWQSQQPVTLLH